MKAYIILFLFVLSFTIIVNSISAVSINNPKLPSIQKTSSVTKNINYSSVNINNSQYLQGYTPLNLPVCYYQFGPNNFNGSGNITLVNSMLKFTATGGVEERTALIGDGTGTTIYSTDNDAADGIKFRSVEGTKDLMFIGGGSSYLGRIGINTSTPRSTLDVNGSLIIQDKIGINTNLSLTDTLQIGNYGTTTTFRKYGILTGDLYQVASNAATKITRVSANSEAFGFDVNGDTQRRLLITSDGRLKWGNGTVTQDTSIERTGINELKVNATLNITSLSGSGNAYACVDSNGKLYRSATACV